MIELLTSPEAWIAFTTEGREDVFVMRADGSDRRQLTDDDHREWQLVDRIGELKKAGMSIRDISRTLEMSKTTVHKYTAIGDHEKPLESIRKVTQPAEGSGDPGWGWGSTMGVFEDEDDPQESSSNDLLPVEDDLDDPVSEDPFSKEPEPEHPFLERDIDRNGREIWVESRAYHGRPLIWYLAQTNGGIPNGKYTRFEYLGLIGNFGKTVDALPTEPARAPP